MLDNLTKAERILRGHQAQELIEQIRPHVSNVQHKYIEWWSLCQDPAEREAIWHRYQALQSVLTDIVSAIADGHIAKEERAHEH